MKKKTEKLTLESFLEKLKTSGYMNALTAKRALGKAQGLSNPDRERARTAIDKHYGVSSPAPAKKAPARKAPPAKKATLKRAAIAKKSPLKKVGLKGGARAVARKGDVVRAIGKAADDSDYVEVQPAAKAPLAYDVHQKMSLAVQSIGSATSGLDILLRVQPALKEESLLPGEFQSMLATGARVIHKANLLGHKSLDAVLGQEQVSDIVGPEEAGIDRPRRPAPKLPPRAEEPPEPSAAHVVDPTFKHPPARVPVTERVLRGDEEGGELTEEPVNSDGRELFRNSHPARGA